MAAHLTSSLLDAIDAGTFERLASHVIRRRYPHLIGHGINAQGKPVVDPLDASADRVWVYHTTQEDLRAKWLATGNRPGDLTVALEEVASLRAKAPNVSITVILATSRRVASAIDQEARERARAANVSIEVLEQSIIADYLDTSPDGQYVRRLFFGTAQERLNIDLLRAVARLSERQYGESSYREQAGALVHRGLDDSLDLAINGGKRVRFLVGQSGHGKTRALHSALTRHRLNGGIGLWMPPEIARTEPRLESAIASTLRMYLPDLHMSAGMTALELTRDTGRPLVIVVDDLNALADPVPTAAKLATWNVRSVHAVLLVPIWPGTWEALPTEARERAGDRIPVGPYREREAVDALRARIEGLDYVRARELAGQCALDPLLIALLPRTPDAVAESRAGGIIRAYIRRVTGDLARRYTAIVSDYDDVLVALGGLVLNHSTLSPALEVIRPEFPDGSSLGTRLRELLVDGRLIHIAGSLRFRHDRLRDVLVADYVSTCLGEGHPQLNDPFFCEPIGLAIARTEANDTVLRELDTNNPLALAYAIAQFGSPTTRSQRTVASLLQGTIAVPGKLPGEYIVEMDRVFTRLDDPVVLNITSGAPDLFTMSRFVNGATDAVLPFARTLIEQRYIDTHEWVKRGLEKNPGGVADEVYRALESSRDDDRSAALAIAPFMADRISAEAVLGSIQNAQRVGQIAADAAVALLRYPDPSGIGVLLDEILRLPSQRSTGNYSYTKGFAVDHIARYSEVLPGPAFDAIDTWARFDFPNRQWMASGILSHTDNPSAVEYCIRALAAQYDESNPMGNAIALDYYVSRWRKRGDPKYPDLSLSRESIDRVVALWANEDEANAIRTVAWRYWLEVRGDDDRSVLIESIGSTDPLCIEAMWFRVRHGDVRMRGAFLERLRENNANWFRLAKYNWDNEVRAEVFRFAREVHAGYIPDGGQSEALYEMASLLRDIPRSDADLFFRDLGQQLDSPRFFMAALYVGTEQALKYASRVEHDVDLEKAFSGFSFFYELGNPARAGRVGPEMLLRLEPFFPTLSQHDLISIRDRASALGMQDWIRSRLDIHLEADIRARIVPSVADHYRRLDSAMRNRSEAWHWYESFEERGEPGRDAMATARSWFAERRTAAAFAVMASLVATYGSREDVAFLRADSIDIDDHAISAMLAHIDLTVSRRSLT